MAEFGTLIALACICLPILLVLVLFAISMVIAVGAIIPMSLSFGAGYLVREIYRGNTSTPPRRAVVE